MSRKKRLVTASGNLSRKAQLMVETAEKAVQTYDNKLFAEMYLHAVKQLALHDNPHYLNFIKQLKQPPVSIEEFLDSDQFIGALKITLWPKVREAIIDLNSNWWKGESVAYDQAIFSRSTASGKSFLAMITMLYHLYLLGCMKKPQLYWGLTATTSIVFIIQAAKPHVTKKVVYAPLRKMVENIPWFIQHMRPYRQLESEMYFPEQNVRLVPSGSGDDAALGEAVIFSLLDEVNFFQVIEKSKKADVGRSSKYDQAKNIHDALSTRRKGRFIKRGPQIGMTICSSSSRYKGDYTDQLEAHAKENKIKTTFVYAPIQYEVVPADRFCGEKFRLFVGSDASTTIRILEDDEKAIGGKVFEVPVEYKPLFIQSPAKALREVIGISTLAISPFFKNPAIIVNSVVRGQENGADSILTTDYIDLDKQGLPTPQRGFVCPDPHKPRYIHVDLSQTTDSTGICMIRFDGLREVHRLSGSSELLPIATMEFCLEIKPSHKNPVNFGEIRSFIHSLIKLYHIPIKAISYDSFNSFESVQAFKKFGMKAGTISVDRSPAPYFSLKTALEDDRIDLYESNTLIEELLGLEFSENTGSHGKVDHTAISSKDLADALCGAFALLNSRSETWRVGGSSINPDGTLNHDDDNYDEERVDMGDRADFGLNRF